MRTRDLARHLSRIFNIKFSKDDYSLLGKISKNETNLILDSITKISIYLVSPNKEQVIKSLLKEISIVSNKKRSDKLIDELI